MRRIEFCEINIFIKKNNNVQKAVNNILILLAVNICIDV